MKNNLIFALTFLLFFACKKETIETPKPTPVSICMIDSTNADGIAQKIIYDEKFRFKKGIVYTKTDTLIQNAVYEGNKVTLTYEKMSGSQTVYLNKMGYCDSLIWDLGTGKIYVEYIYDTLNQPIEKIVYGEVSGTEIDEVTSLEWLNGNLIKETTEYSTGVSVISREFDLSQKNTLQTYESSLLFVPSSKNLVTKTSINGDIIVILYSYFFDSKNRVNKVQTIVDEGVSEVFYHWTCTN
jgi:hypothetical protein